MNIFSIASTYLPIIVSTLHDFVFKFFSPIGEVFIISSDTEFGGFIQFLDLVLEFFGVDFLSFSLFDLMFSIGLPLYICFVILKFGLDLIF